MDWKKVEEYQDLKEYIFPSSWYLSCKTLIIILLLRWRTAWNAVYCVDGWRLVQTNWASLKVNTKVFLKHPHVAEGVILRRLFKIQNWQVFILSFFFTKSIIITNSNMVLAFQNFNLVLFQLLIFYRLSMRREKSTRTTFLLQNLMNLFTNSTHWTQNISF